MEKRVVLITGAASGIGKGIAEKFTSTEHLLLLADLKGELLESTKNELLKSYPEAAVETIAGDLSEPDFIGHIITVCQETYGTLHAVINCAGVFPSTPFLDISRDEWNQVLDLNVSAVFFLTQASVRLMLDTDAEDAVIVNISSAASEVARPGVAHYCSSKAALKMLTQVLALELAPYGIRVNAVGPGLVETETLLNTLITEKAKKEHEEKISFSPLGRTAKISEIADVVHFIASKEASYITGQNLLVDGGYSAGRVFKSFA